MADKGEMKEQLETAKEKEDFTFLTRLCLYFNNIDDTSKEELEYLTKKSLIELNKQLATSKDEEMYYLENVWFKRPAGITSNIMRMASIQKTDDFFSEKIKEIEIGFPKAE